MDAGWNVTHMARVLVTSRAYRQTSRGNPTLDERDPLNRLVARQSRFRLDAELVRDNALAISGLLVDKQGGPSVRPYQPAGYYAPLNFPRREYVAEPEAAWQLINTGEWPVAKDLPAPELAAWTAVARAILNLNETITRN